MVFAGVNGFEIATLWMAGTAADAEVDANKETMASRWRTGASIRRGS
jgi:hypothetical protein